MLLPALPRLRIVEQRGAALWLPQTTLLYVIIRLVQLLSLLRDDDETQGVVFPRVFEKTKHGLGRESGCICSFGRPVSAGLGQTFGDSFRDKQVGRIVSAR